MSFVSLSFAAFVLAALPLYYLTPVKHRPLFLALLSAVFYLLSEPLYLPVLLAVSIVTFYAGRALGSERSEQSKLRLTLWIVALLVINLAFFKYFSFFKLVLAPVLPPPQLLSPYLKVVLPLGLSYYSFRAIGYILDCYWEKAQPEQRFDRLLAYLSFFPHLLSGPIQKAQDFQAEMPAANASDRATSNRMTFDSDLARSGLELILWGLFKKVVIADNLAKYVSAVYDQPNDFGGAYVLWALYFFAFQLYADFSGLTDMAIGVGRLFGINAPQNFARPFYASNIQDFWRRWHITLTNWLSTYLFTPLHMSLRGGGQWGLMAAITINMLAIGVWHGPTLIFVAFGVFHAVLMVVSVLTMPLRDDLFEKLRLPTKLRSVVGGLITFHLVTLSFVFWKAGSVPAAFELLGRLAAPSSAAITTLLAIAYLKLGILLIALLLLLERFTSAAADPFENQFGPRGQLPSRSLPEWMRRHVLSAILIALILFLGALDGEPFIYQQF